MGSPRVQYSPAPKDVAKTHSVASWTPVSHQQMSPRKKAVLKCGLTSVNSFSAPKFGPDHSLLSFNALML